MNHLTNLYKHKCEQLQEQINNLKRMLNEAEDRTPPTQGNPAPENAPGYAPPIQTDDGRWYSPVPPVYTPPVFDPDDSTNPDTYKKWLRKHPAPDYDPQVMDERWDEYQRWERGRQEADQYYKDQQRIRAERGYYTPDVQGVIRAADHWSQQIIPDDLNPFW